MTRATSETPKHAARRLSAKALADGYEPQALHVYTADDGEPLHWRIRLKHPATGDQWIRPMKRNGVGFVLGEPDYPEGKPLYRLHDLTRDPEATVIVCEGEWCADALAKRGVTATTSGAATSAADADFRPLAGRSVLIWPDHDEPGQAYTEDVAARLLALGARVRVVVVAALDLPPKGDAIDWLDAHANATARDILDLPSKPYAAAVDTDDAEEDRSRKSQASELVDFVREHAELFHDRNKQVYAHDGKTHETRRIDGRAFRDWLLSRFYAAAGISARDQSVREALATLGGIGRCDSPCCDVHVRVAEHEGAYYLDLAEPGNSRAVMVTSHGWTVVIEPPVRFVRPDAMQPLPEPTRDGSLDPLWSLVNVPTDARLLVVAYLLECLRPETPFPVLELIGEQGSAKSTTQRVLRTLIDPNDCALRAAPKCAEDLFVSAGSTLVVSLENISHLSGPLQDALCVLATGGGFAKRKLYTDADEAVIDVQRPVMLNGISAAITAQDLLDRTVSVELPVISERTEVTALQARFGDAHARILGGLFDAFACALQHLPSVELAAHERPRLLEFARLGTAVGLATDHDEHAFMQQFTASREEAIARTIDANPVATAVMEFVSDRGAVVLPLKALLRELEAMHGQRSELWPKTPKRLGDDLRRAAPALRTLGIDVRSLGKRGGVVLWRIAPRGNLSDPCPECPASPADTLAVAFEQDMQDTQDIT